MSDILISSTTDDEIVVLKEGVALDTILTAVDTTLGYRNEAEGFRTGIETYATNALNSANQSAASATASANSATQSATQATAALGSATNAATSATNASISETNASNSATTATTQAGIATTKATEASSSATSASGSATTATTQAGISTTKASEASASATNAQLRAWEAEAQKMTADSYASESEDVFVKTYTSNGDGTFTSSDTAEYSALHWAAKTSIPKTNDPVIEAGSTPTEGVQYDLAITNYSTDNTYTIVPTGCSVNNNAGTLEITSVTQYNPSFTIKSAHTDLANTDSSVVTRNMTAKLSTPVITPPADSSINTDVAYTFTVSDNSDTFVLNLGTTDYTYVSTSATLVSDSAGVITVNGITGTSVTITVQFTVAATYSSVNGTSSDSAGNWTTSATSANDSIVIDSGVVNQTNFEVATYDGNGSTQTINLGVISTGVDFVWIKRRSGAQSHAIFDSVRGNNNRLYSDLTNAEATDSLTFSTSSIDIGNTGNLNASSEKFVAWCASLPTDNASNTNGTITSVTKNNDFMSVISYTQSTVSQTAGHSLSGTPEIVIRKRTDGASDWYVGVNIGAINGYMLLNTTAAITSSFTSDSTTFETAYLSSGTENWIAYAFRSVAGKCKIGSYTGTGASGNTVTTNFEPAWVMIKRTDSTGDWIIFDSVRDNDAGAISKYLLANTSASEGDSVGFQINTTVASFEPNDSNAQYNASGGTYIYMAIAKNPVRSPKTFDTELYTGNGTTQNIAMTNITDGVDFSWVKCRNSTPYHILQDSIRGTASQLFSNDTLAEETRTDRITAFNNSSIDVGSYTDVNINTNTYVSWNFSLPTDTASNTAGTITSVTKNNDFMSIVSYTGTGVNATVGHSLGKVPELIIVKDRNAVSGWAVYNKTTGNTTYLTLNATSTPVTLSSMWQNTTPTSTVFSIGTDGWVNTNTNAMIAYAFASVNGVCKVGKYTGTGAAGNFVDCGFQPAFVMIKRTDSTSNWLLFDLDRSDGTNSTGNIYPNLSNAEDTASLGTALNFENSGFSHDSYTSSDFNALNGTYIYLAIATGA